MPGRRKRGVTPKAECPVKKRKVSRKNIKTRLTQTPEIKNDKRKKLSLQRDSNHVPVKIRLERAIESCNNCAVIQILTSSHGDDYCSPKLRNEALLNACYQGMLPTVRTLVNCGAVINKKIKTNRGTPLNAAVEGGFVDLVQFLLEKGADVNQRSLYGETPLTLSIKKQYSSSLTADLIKAGADVDARNQCGKTAAMLAIEKFDLKTLMLLIESGANLKLTNASGQTALDLASDLNILETVKLISEHKADINAILNKAVNNNQLDILKDLINCGMVSRFLVENNESVSEISQESTTIDLEVSDLSSKDGDIDNNNATAKITTPPLCLAAASGKLDLAKMLIDTGFGVNAKESSERMTPMMYAASNGHEEIIKILYSSGADVNAIGKSCYTALTYAVKGRHANCVKILLKLGATVNKRLDFLIAATQEEINCLKLLSKHADLSELDSDVLSAAIRSSNYKAVTYLLDNGMDVNSVTDSGEAIILQSRNKKMVQLLIRKGALVNFVGELFTGEDDDEDIEAKEEILPLLIKHGANLNETAYSNHSPLISATIRNRTNLVRIMLEAGTDPGGTSPQKQTALMFAAQRDYTDIIRLLLDKGASVDAQDKSGMSALMFAAMNSCLDSVQLLLESGAIIDLEDTKGNTALMLSTNDEVVTLLVTSGAKVNKRNNEGLTPLKLAKNSARVSLQKTLESLGAVSEDFENL